MQISDNFGKKIRTNHKSSQNVRKRPKSAKICEKWQKVGHFGVHRPKLVHGMTKLAHGVTKTNFANFPLTLLKSLDNVFLWVKNTLKVDKMTENCLRNAFSLYFINIFRI